MVKYNRGQTKKIVQQPIKENEDEYEVEKIIDKRITKGAAQYQVKWLGYEKKEDLTWEPSSNLAGCKALVNAFENAKKKQNTSYSKILKIPKTKAAKSSKPSRTITRTPAKIPKSKVPSNPFKTPPKPVEGKLGVDAINKLLGLKKIDNELRV